MTRRNWAFDIALAVVVGVLGQLEAWAGFNSTHRQGPHWVEALLYAVCAALLVWRRVRPIGVLLGIVLTSTLEFALVGSPEGMGVLLPAMVAVYTVARCEEPRRSWWGLFLGVVYWVAWSSLDPMSQSLGLRERLMVLVWLAPFVIAWLVGALVRITALYTEQRRLTRQQSASRAVAEERNRIARELHDVIGHSVSVMTVQASAVRRRLTPDQQVEREALETVEGVGREALAEMRRMVGVLRQDGDRADLEPPPGLDQVERLAEQFRASGLPVHIRVTGAAQALAPGLDLTAYRLVQEGLTNTLRHAQHPRQAEVAIDYGQDELHLAVRDDGEVRSSQSQPAEAGNGLLGMRERVAVYGGELVARVRPEGGFELMATLPLVSA